MIFFLLLGFLVLSFVVCSALVFFRVRRRGGAAPVSFRGGGL